MPLWDPQQERLKAQAERRRVRSEVRAARFTADTERRCETCQHFVGNHHPESGCFVPGCKCVGTR